MLEFPFKFKIRSQWVIEKEKIDMQRLQTACIIAVMAQAKKKVGIRSVLEEMLETVKFDIDDKIQGLQDQFDTFSIDLQGQVDTL